MAEIKMMCDVSLESTQICSASVCPNCKTTKNVVYSSASGQYTCLACNIKY